MQKKDEFIEIEKKWQKIWKKEKLYEIDLKKANKPFYNLMMFPYPSAEGLHIGNMYAFTGADIYARFKRMQGHRVFEPIGLDGFGIHSENYALKVDRTPQQHAKISEENFYKQLHSIGNSFDWSKKLETYDPNYYKWTQWLFIQLFKTGLAYRKKAEVNYCPSCKTVVADEQIINGKCERCSSTVEKKELEQWFFKITKYAKRLLNNIDKLNWTDKVKLAQKNWIGQKIGINIKYKILKKDIEVEVFTTKPETNFGATFIVLAPEHPLALKLSTQYNRKKVEKYILESKHKSSLEIEMESNFKTGVFTGCYALNPLNNYKMPIWIANYVLMEFGTGAIVGVPGHDKRDFEFAKKFSLEIKRVVVDSSNDISKIDRLEKVIEEGKIINSDFLNGLDSISARAKIISYIVANEFGKKQITYHLRDWLISRQRYWGPPIPMIYCEKCSWQPVAQKELPVLLPELKDWKPTGDGRGPLTKLREWVNITCPKCDGPAKRETDVSDSFLDSSWYFFRYTSTNVQKEPFDKGIVSKWLPVNMYIGGAEHSVLHLLYARFITMFLKDLNLINFEEPFASFYAHGLVIKDGAKMSKSKGNIIVPDDYIERYGADTLRCYLMFLGPFSKGGDFNDKGIEGMYKFIKRIYNLGLKVASADEKNITLERKQVLHKTIKKATAFLEELKYNLVLASLMEYYNYISKSNKVYTNELEILFKILAPFAPHITEEIWQEKLNTKNKNHFNSIHFENWPSWDNKYIRENKKTIAIEINGKLKSTIEVNTKQAKIEDKKEIEEKAMNNIKVNTLLKNKKILRVIYIRGKVINFVIK